MCSKINQVKKPGPQGLVLLMPPGRGPHNIVIIFTSHWVLLFEIPQNVINHFINLIVLYLKRLKVFVHPLTLN